MASTASSLDYLRSLLTQHTNDFDEELYIICKDYCATNRAAFKSLKKAKSKKFIETNELSLLPVREQIEIVMERPFATPYGRVVFFAQTTVVCGSVICLMMETVPMYSGLVNSKYDAVWFWTECCMTVYFTLETILRFAVSEEKKDFFKKPANVMDLLSISPFYIELLTNESDTFAPFRVVRLFRLMKFLRNLQAIDNLVQAVERSVKALIAPVVFLAACMLFMSGVVYYSEKGTYDTNLQQFMIADCSCESSPHYHLTLRNNGTKDAELLCPKKESQFYSIPHTMWWAVVTMATVGYGDLVPQCSLGKVFASVSIVLGVFFMAMPIAIVGSYFTMVVDENDKEMRMAKNRLLVQGRDERRKLHDLVLAKELYTVTDQELQMFCLNVKVAPKSTRQETESMLYQIVTPPDTQKMSLAKDTIRFLCRTVPEGTVSLTDPSPPFLHQLETYLRKLIDSDGTKERYMSNTGPSLCCTGLFKVPELNWSSYIMNKPILLSVGGKSHSMSLIGQPDVTLPFQNIPPRAALLSLAITPVDWVVKIVSVPPVVVLVNKVVVGTVLADAIQLRNGDVLDFGTEETPCIVNFFWGSDVKGFEI
jgi:hypothetical protein